MIRFPFQEKLSCEVGLLGSFQFSVLAVLFIESRERQCTGTLGRSHARKPGPAISLYLKEGVMVVIFQRGREGGSR
jgi:hypothetical protein